MARWCVPTPPPPLRASAGRHAATHPPSVGAAWAQTLPTITLSMTSRSTSTLMRPFLLEVVAMVRALAGGPCLWLLMTLLSPRSAGEEDWWTTGMSSWHTRHTSCITHHRPGGNNGSEYGQVYGFCDFQAYRNGYSWAQLPRAVAWVWSCVLGHVCFLLLPLLSCTDLTCHVYGNQPCADYSGGPIKHNYCEHEAFLPTVKRFRLFSHFQSNFMAKNYPSFTTC